MILSKDQISIVKTILQDKCSDKTITRSEIFDIFESKTKSGIEKYVFERALSKIIRTGIISGYEVKVGRNGGICRTTPLERVTIQCSKGIFVGCIPVEKIEEFIDNWSMKNSHR